MKNINNIKVAIVCDWLTNPGGAEKVVEVLADIFPEAPIFTSVCDRNRFKWLKKRKLITSWLDRLPIIRYKHQLMAPFRPMVFEGFDFSEYDLVFSLTSAEAKNIITKPKTIHICYCHTPIRYYWSDYHEYLNHRLEFGVFNPLIKLIMPFLVNSLRISDRMAADRVDYFLANSINVKTRIEKYYRRESEVIYPPVEDEFEVKRGEKSQNDYYLCLGRLVPYKKADLVVEAFVKNGRRLLVSGEGPLLSRLKKIAEGKRNIEILGRVDDNEKKILLENCKALVFPAEEDFGIVPVEAMMCGKPVVAFGKGGARETVVEDLSGVFFEKQDVHSLNKAIVILERKRWDEKKISAWASKFRREVFVKNINEFVAKVLKREV